LSQDRPGPGPGRPVRRSSNACGERAAAAMSQQPPAAMTARTGRRLQWSQTTNIGGSAPHHHAAVDFASSCVEELPIRERSRCLAWTYKERLIANAFHSRSRRKRSSRALWLSLDRWPPKRGPQPALVNDADLRRACGYDRRATVERKVDREKSSGTEFQRTQGRLLIIRFEQQTGDQHPVLWGG
jgi:hypothetical protein